MKKLKLALLLMVLISSIMITGCTNRTPPNGSDTIEVTDSLGRSVDVPKDVERVVGLEAGTLRLLVYLECTDLVVGVEDEEYNGGRPYNYAQPELAELPSIGPIHGGDAELIMAQKPDVILWTFTTEGDADDLQKKTGIPVVALDYGDLGVNRDHFFDSLRLVGKVMDRSKRAEVLVGYFEEVIEDLDERTKDIPDAQKMSVYVGGIGYRGAHGILSTEPDYEPVAFVNGKNVAGDLGTEHAFIDKEKLLEWDPDIILADQAGSALIKEDLKDQAYANIDAVKNGNVFGVMPYNYYAANYGTILADAYYIGVLLFPEQFDDINPEAKADEIYQELVGTGVYEDMEQTYGGFGKIVLT